MLEEEKFLVKSPNESTRLPMISVGQFITEQLLKQQQQQTIAVIDATDIHGNGIQITWGELDRKIRQQAARFLAIGLEKNDLVVMFADNSLDYLISMFALMYLGITFSPLTPASGCFELIGQIEDSQATTLWIDGKRLPIVEKAIRERTSIRELLRFLFICDDVDESILSEMKQYPIQIIANMRKLDNEILERVPYFDTSPNDYLMIIYTSGSTGLPKGAIHTQTSVLASTFIFRPQQMGIRYLMWYPFGHVSGIFATLKTLCWGQTLILEQCCQLPRMLLDVERYQATQMPIAPSQAIDLLNHDHHRQFNLQSLKVISFAGAKIPADTLEQIKSKYQVKISELYGSTEMMGSVVQPAHQVIPPGSVGVPQSNNEMKIIDIETKENLPAFQQGEICFRGPARFLGYLRNLRATDEVIDSNGWYHTGDIGYYDDNGHLYVVDRIKALIKFRYWSISPAEIELFLQQHPAIDNVCVVGVKHLTEGHIIRAYVQMKKGNQISEQELLQYTRENLGFQKQLRGGVRFVDQIRRTAIGKVDRQYYNRLNEGQILADPVID